MSQASPAERALPWALGASVLVSGYVGTRLLRALSRTGVQKDALLLLEHPAGDAWDGFIRAGGDTFLRLGLLLFPVLVLLTICWSRRARLAWSAPLAATILVLVAAGFGARLLEQRSALRTLCWAARSPVYGRSVRDRALAIGQARLRSPLGRLAERLGAQAAPTCAAAAHELATVDSGGGNTDH